MLDKLNQLGQPAGAVIVTMLAALLVSLGILVIVHPALIAWIVGIGLMLAGVGLLAAMFAPGATSS
jgi:hypothetical protein